MLSIQLKNSSKTKDIYHWDSFVFISTFWTIRLVVISVAIALHSFMYKNIVWVRPRLNIFSRLNAENILVKMPNWTHNLFQKCHSASAGLVAFCRLLLPFRARKNFVRYSLKNVYDYIVVTNFQHTILCSLKNLRLWFLLQILLKMSRISASIFL